MDIEVGNLVQCVRVDVPDNGANVRIDGVPGHIYKVTRISVDYGQTYIWGESTVNNYTITGASFRRFIRVENAPVAQPQEPRTVVYLGIIQSPGLNIQSVTHVNEQVFLGMLSGYEQQGCIVLKKKKVTI